jgi:hypothetical protein
MSTAVINVRDLTVPDKSTINIAVINQPNPVEGYTATADEVWQLLHIMKYSIVDSSTLEPITGENYYDYFPEKKPDPGPTPPGPGPGPSPSTDTEWYGFAKPKITAVPGTVVTTIERS